jgi:hypothetical protein
VPLVGCRKDFVNGIVASVSLCLCGEVLKNTVRDLFQILHLFTHFFHLVFQFHCLMGDT